MSGCILTTKEIQEVKKRAETQFNWANTSVLSLIATIESLQAENKAYETNNKNQAIELDKAYEMIGNLQRIVDKY